jgi:DNA polymerase-3 subunit gamma/tau
MSYQVLARKWRPRSFPEMVGQEHVLRALVNALDNDRLHHAYLFTGTRGVGKTTVARILAKSLNCEQGVGSTPCGQCDSCREIDEGRFVDLIEVDAASRTKVEDTRELLDNVQYAPTRGRYKVYLIDEVHMLSTHSFNALLKTLEEPPPHIKFLLATTDPQRLPVTILSRCLQFNLKRLPPGLIREHLSRIVEQEGVEAESEALAEIARAADGSMRDGLSLLDQAIAYGNGRLVAEEVRGMLGTVDRDRVYALIEALAGGDAAALMAEVERLADYAPDFGEVLAELTSALHRIAVAQAVPDAFDADAADREAVLTLAGRLSPEDVQLYYQIGVTGRRDLPLAPDPRTGLEMTLLRMLAFRPLKAGAATPAGGPGVARKPSAPKPPPSRQAATPPVSAAEAEPAPRQNPPAVAEPAPSSEPVPKAGAGRPDWEATVQGLEVGGLIQQLALHCALRRREGERVELTLDPAHRHLHNAKREQALAEALGAYLGQPIRLSIDISAGSGETPAQAGRRRAQARQQEAETAISEDPNVQSILERFDGRVDPESITPTD